MSDQPRALALYFFGGAVECFRRHQRIENPQLDGDIADIMLNVPIQLRVLNSLMPSKTFDRPAEKKYDLTSQPQYTDIGVMRKAAIPLIFLVPDQTAGKFMMMSMPQNKAKIKSISVKWSEIWCFLLSDMGCLPTPGAVAGLAPMRCGSIDG